MSLALFLIGAAGCGSRPSPTVTPAPATATVDVQTIAQVLAAAADASTGAPLGTPAVTAAGVPATVSALPVSTPLTGTTPLASLTGLPAGSFRYEVRLKPAGEPNIPETVVSGRYRDGSWQETARTGDGDPQELIVSGGDTYTRPTGETTWTRWPGIGFDAAYGLTAPLTVLRLYPQAARSDRPVLDLVPGAPEPTFRAQTLIGAATVDQATQAGVRATVADAAGQASLNEQLKPMAVDQTITYWRGESGRIYKASGDTPCLRQRRATGALDGSELALLELRRPGHRYLRSRRFSPGPRCCLGGTADVCHRHCERR